MSAPWTAKLATMLEDPIMLQSAVDYYSQVASDPKLAEPSVERRQLGALWFGPDALRRWFDGDDIETQDLLLTFLPPELLAALAPAIARRWRAWPLAMARKAAKALTAAAPEQAAGCFQADLDANDPPPPERTLAIAENLAKLPPAAALAMLERLLPLNDATESKLAAMARPGLFEAAARLRHPALPHIMDRLLTEKDIGFKSMLEVAAAGLFGHSSYAVLALTRWQSDNRRDFPSFKKLGALFEPDAPLQEMDRIVLSKAPMPAAMLLLESCQARSAQSRLGWDALRQSELLRAGTYPAHIAALALGAVAAAFERKALGPDVQTLEQLAGLLAHDIDTNIHFAALAERLRQHPRKEVAKRLTSALRAAHRHYYGGITIMRMMGELGSAEFAQPLIDCLGEDRGDFACEAAMYALQQIGAPAAATLIGQWQDLDDTQQIYGSLPIASVGGTAGADFVLRSMDGLFELGSHVFADLATACPDARIAEALRPHLQLKDARINLTFYFLCRLLDLDYPELPAVHARVAATLREQRRFMRNFELETSREFRDGQALNLRLRCAACGAAWRHDAKGVVIGDAAKHEKPWLADEARCPRCGAPHGLDLDDAAEAAIAPELAAVAALRAGGKPYGGPLTVDGALTLADGAKLPLHQAYAQFQQAVHADPSDWRTFHRLGNLMRDINRPTEAKDFHAKAYAANPVFLEGVVSHAQALLDAGKDRPAALEVLRQAIANLGRLHSVASDPKQARAAFAALCDTLRDEPGTPGLPPLPPDFLDAHAKTGRNDPCPCGSGKKFKKCCMKA